MRNLDGKTNRRWWLHSGSCETGCSLLRIGGIRAPTLWIWICLLSCIHTQCHSLTQYRWSGRCSNHDWRWRNYCGSQQRRWTNSSRLNTHICSLGASFWLLCLFSFGQLFNGVLPTLSRPLKYGCFRITIVQFLFDIICISKEKNIFWNYDLQSQAMAAPNTVWIKDPNADN